MGDAAPDDSLERFREALRTAGVRLTHQRLEIFREVAGRIDHPSAEAVLRAVQPRMPTVSLDTVYRTLRLLTDLGLIATLGPRRDSVRFDANLSRHHHFVCSVCGLARDFVSEELNVLPVPVEVKAFGAVTSVHVEVLGVCAACSGKGAPGA